MTQHIVNPNAKMNSKLLIGLIIILANAHALFATLNLSGPITLSNVTTSGSITVSSMTMNSATITNLQSLGKTSGTQGVLQIKFSSTTASVQTTTTTFVAVSTFMGLSNFKCSMALSDPANYVRITLSTILQSKATFVANGFATIMRDGIDLGNSDNSGITAATSNLAGNTSDLFNPIPMTITDRPNDTLSHTYTVAIRTSNSAELTLFNPSLTTAYLVCEEMHL